MRDFIYSTPKPFFALPLCSTHNVKRSRKISERIISLSAVQHMRRSRLLFFLSSCFVPFYKLNGCALSFHSTIVLLCDSKWSIDLKVIPSRKLFASAKRFRELIKEKIY